MHKAGFEEKVTFIQRLKGNEGVTHEAFWMSQWLVQRPCGLRGIRSMCDQSAVLEVRLRNERDQMIGTFRPRKRVLLSGRGTLEVLSRDVT